MRPHEVGITSLGGDFDAALAHFTSLPLLYRKAGFYTARFGKVFHMGVPDAMARCSRGADDPHAWDEVLPAYGYELNSNGSYYNATPYEEDTVGAGGAVAWLQSVKGGKQQYDYQVAHSVAQKIEARQDSARPFFLAAGFIRPHVPWVAPKEFFELYDTAGLPLPPSAQDDRQGMATIHKDYWSSDFKVSSSEHKRALRAYYASISFLDAQIGRLIQALKATGQYEQTAIVLLSDHGYQTGEHGFWFKNYLYEESALSPLMIKLPGQKEGIVKEPVELLDVFPTLVAFSQLPQPRQHLEGQSLLPLMKGKEGKRYAVVQTKRGEKDGFALNAHKDWCYMEFDSGRAGQELYNMNQDPYQMHNLAGKTDYESIQDSLRHHLHHVLASTP